jgi:hypothetical protein
MERDGGLRFRQRLAAPDLSKIQQAHNCNASHNIAKGSREQPLKIIAEVQMT